MSKQTSVGEGVNEFKIEYPNGLWRESAQAKVSEIWGGCAMVVDGKIWDTRKLPCIAALDENDTILGYLFYLVRENEYEIIALESMCKNIGVATALIDKVKALARTDGYHTVVVMTTNDNTKAFRFYQKRGFNLRAVRFNALDISRKLKPTIPLIGDDDIKLQHELELDIEV